LRNRPWRYRDRDNPYTIRAMDFTNDKDIIIVKNTHRHRFFAPFDKRVPLSTLAIGNLGLKNEKYRFKTRSSGEY
jgi:galactose-1-phosphate uridylyltransferase